MAMVAGKAPNIRRGQDGSMYAHVLLNGFPVVWLAPEQRRVRPLGIYQPPPSSLYLLSRPMSRAATGHATSLQLYAATLFSLHFTFPTNCKLGRTGFFGFFLWECRFHHQIDTLSDATHRSTRKNQAPPLVTDVDSNIPVRLMGSLRSPLSSQTASVLVIPPRPSLLM